MFKIPSYTKLSATKPRSSGTRLMLATALVTSLAVAGCASISAPGTTENKTDQIPEKPVDTSALRKAAVTSTKTQDYVAAAAYWGNLYDRNPSDTEAALNYSKALRQIGSNDQALMVMQRTQQTVPNDGTVLAEYGKVLAASGHAIQAQSVLDHANELQPHDWTILSAQGVTLDQLGRYKDAQTKYAAALKIAPDNPSVLTNLGLSYALVGNLTQAELTLRKAVSDPHANASARQNLSVVLALQGKFDEAKRLARADLPINIADNNIAYLRNMLTQPALWKQMETLDESTQATN